MARSKEWMPVVLWHGMGDCCCNPLSLGKIDKVIRKTLGNETNRNEVYIHSIKIGNNVFEDTLNGYFKNVNEQVEEACQQIRNDPRLSSGYNAIGFSQGSQFLRALAQRCPGPNMNNLISIGGQHQGVFGLPHCEYPDSKYCDYIRKILDVGAYWSWVQAKFVQAEYWHDPYNEEEYIDGSVFLAEINNEKTLNRNYITNLRKLKNFVMVKFNQDTMVIPRESEWFGFYTPGQGINITSLRDSRLYKEDRLGLQKMDKAGKLHFLEVDGDHLQFEMEWFIDNIINKFLRVTI
ncbi:palmitoyl-protein thioesterase 1 [Nilaparvata lugens]|uniref:palmitoyl-protein thioesterase 1 n=1 Tax=Nilaparvata lugens TaxID=108931 RepID=UPI00193D162A|nr:palmitoyl-protein thioesterase 1 [Nilaparvata lugens]